MRRVIAFISDIHDSPQPLALKRHGEFGQVFLRKVVHRLNHGVKPDVVVLLGDLLDDPSAPDATERLAAIKKIMDRLKAPWLAIPGNHDPAPARFYQTIPDPGDTCEIAGIRFLRFLDPEMPGWNARREPAQLERTRRARGDGFAGPVVALHHVPLFPPGSSPCCFNYVNAEEVVAAMVDAGITLAVGGHFHPGTELVRRGNTAMGCIPALTEEPFAYSIVHITDDGVTQENQQLKLAPGLNLCDYHSHTQFAYCSEDMNAETSPALAALLGVKAQALTEHSGQLYFVPERFWSGGFCASGIRGRLGRQDRMTAYWATTDGPRARFEHLRVGLEVDADYQGRPVLRREDADRADLLVGAVHFLPEAHNPKPDPARLADEYLASLHSFFGSGIDILAHPFRLFVRTGSPPPQRVRERVLALAKRHGVALEINGHGENFNDPEFFAQAIRLGLKLTLATDAHNLADIGEFSTHLALLAQMGVTGDPSEVLLPMPMPRRKRAARQHAIRT